ncbi:monocarboxylate transporter 7-like isoform X2 [Apostichopus japonicus]|uniref:monocarboxylate transporter 7-like isoform X2 n=1 Tax=Stichopus japonicus TaxID=307972 RepID=UPI003AB783F8
MGHVAAITVRYLVYGLQGGSLKCNGVLVEGLTRQANISFTLTGLILSLQQSLAYLAAPLASVIYQRFGARVAVSCGGLLVAFGYIGNGVLPLHPILLFIFCCCAGIGFGIASTPTYMFLKEAFPDKTVFGIVQGIADQAQYVGVSILPVVFDKLQYAYGMQGALLLFAGINLNILVAAALLKPIRRSTIRESLAMKDSTVHDSEKEGGRSAMMNDSIERYVRNDTNKTETSSQSREKAGNSSPASSEEIQSSNHDDQSDSYYAVLNRNRSLIFLMLVALSTSFSYFGWVLFLIPLGKEKGLTSEDAVLLSTFTGMGAFIGRVWSIILFVRRTKSPFQFFGMPCLLQSIMFFLLAKSPSDFYTLAGISFVTGICFGCTGSSVGGVCSLKVRESDFNKGIVLTFLPIALGTEVGGGVTGAVHDVTGSSEIVFLVLTGSSLYIVLMSIIWSVYEWYETPQKVV